VTESRSIGEILRDAEAGRLDNILADEREPYDLIGSAERLFELLHEREIEYVLVGGIAVLQYVEGRNTVDIDLIVEPQFGVQLPELTLLSEDGHFARASFHGVQLDLLKTSNPVFALVRAKYSSDREYSTRKVQCATPQGLFLLKSYALPSLYRQGDFSRVDLYEGDLLALLRRFPIDEDEILKELGPHMLETDIKTIRDIVREIRERLSRTIERGEELGD
jgi:hypothetical protein